MKKNMKSRITKNIWTVLLFIVAISAKAQISGIVSETNTGKPLPAASIYLKGTQTGAITDSNGHYQIAALENDILVFSFTGFQTHEETVGKQSIINISLQEDHQQLNEVVVVGYGTQKRKELTGSVASVGKNTLKQQSVSVDGLLRGAISGVNVSQVSGQPGAGSEIRIRGGNSVYANNEPLYVIDGFIYYNERYGGGVGNIESSINPLASINPADIESIDILKDVSAKAIYGSRGANGVILITTKKGERGKNSVNYQYTLGIDKSAKKLKLLNAEQFRRINKNDVTWGNPDWIRFYDEQSAAADKAIDTDWQDAVLQTGITQAHEISVSGGDDKTRYLLSGNYTNQQGIILHSDFERFSGRVNIDRRLNNNLTVGITANADRSTQRSLTALTAGAGNGTPQQDGITNSLVYALFMPPVIPIKDYNTGEYNYYNPFERHQAFNYSSKNINPVNDLENTLGENINTTLLGNFYAKYYIPKVEGLAVKFSAGINVNYSTQNFFAPVTTMLGTGDDYQGRGSISNRRTDVSQTEYLLTYSKKLGTAHYVDALLGYTYQKTNTNIVLSRAVKLDEFELGRGVALRNFSRAENAGLHSLLGRINYTLLSKYNLTATFRADNSSRFAENHKWGYFPSLGASWNVSDEIFFKNVKPAFSTLKLRATYGSSGNQEIGFSEFDAYLNSGEYNGELAFELTNLGNKNLRWETTKEYNVGIDAGFLKDRITLVADVYYKKTNDLLVKVPPPFGSATNNKQTFNIGNVTNKGFEFALDISIIEQKSIQWTVTANFARNINTITSLGKYNNLTEGDKQETILRVGESVGSFYGYIFDGVVQANEVVVENGVQLAPGSIKRRDLNGDHEIDSNDKTVLGSIQPDFTYGFSTFVNWRHWDFSLSLQGSQGNEVYNRLRQHLNEGNLERNRSAELLNAWTPENPSNEVPALDAYIDYKSIYSRYVEDASFIKLRNITLGYTLPVKINSSEVKFRLFVSGQNLLTISKYKGYDPEVPGGIDTGIYPHSRSVLFGAGLKF
jgi:TonB-linked SusC/RagA family outer membrane protein